MICLSSLQVSLIVPVILFVISWLAFRNVDAGMKGAQIGFTHGRKAGIIEGRASKTKSKRRNP